MFCEPFWLRWLHHCLFCNRLLKLHFLQRFYISVFVYTHRVTGKFLLQNNQKKCEEILGKEMGLYCPNVRATLQVYHPVIQYEPLSAVKILSFLLNDVMVSCKTVVNPFAPLLHFIFELCFQLSVSLCKQNTFSVHGGCLILCTSKNSTLAPWGKTCFKYPFEREENRR